MKGERRRLLDMRRALDAIERYAAAGSLPAEARLVWIAHHFIAMGQAAAGLECEGPWRALEGAARFLAQDPFAIDPAPIEATLANGDLERIRRAIDRALA